MDIITCENLKLGYEGKVIVENINFAVEEGDYLCIVGENGSGKSTLMKALLGLIPPIDGYIYRELSGSAIGYLPQQTQVQRDFPASVKEIVLSGCDGNKKSFFHSAADKEAAMMNMEKLRISHLADKCYRELSGGQQQRVLLARALCAAQKVLLLDEPVTGLDPQATFELYDIIDDLNVNDGLAIIMITHDMAAVDAYAKHVLHLSGHICFGTKEEYYARHAR